MLFLEIFRFAPLTNISTMLFGTTNYQEKAVVKKTSVAFVFRTVQKRLERRCYGHDDPIDQFLDQHVMLLLVGTARDTQHYMNTTLLRRKITSLLLLYYLRICSLYSYKFNQFLGNLSLSFFEMGRILSCPDGRDRY